MKSLELPVRNLGDAPEGQSVLVAEDLTALTAIITTFLSDGTLVTLSDGSQYRFYSNATFGGMQPTTGPGRWWQTGPGGNGINVKTFGAVGDGVADDTVAIQTALDSVPNGPNAYCPTKVQGGAGRVTLYFPSGTYKVTSVLDCSARDFVQIVGIGRAEIQSYSNTYIIDMASTFMCHIRDISLISYTARVGVYFNRVNYNPYCIYNKFQNVVIYVGTNTALNGGIGSIGIYNNRGEQDIFENCDVKADLPVYITQYPDAAFAPTYGVQNVAITSCVIGSFNRCNFFRHTKHTYVVYINGANSHRFSNCYWATLDLTSGTVKEAIYAKNISSCDFEGVMEGTERFMFVDGTSYFCKINLVPDAFLSSGGVINFDSTNATGMQNCEITVVILQAVVGGSVIQWSNTAGGSFQFIGNKIRTGQAALITAISYVNVNADVRFNTVLTETGNEINGATLTGPFGTFASAFSCYNTGAELLFSVDVISRIFRLGRVTDYADNAAALAGGLGIGDIYRITGTDGLAVVH
jgi:hypothetical protein